MPTRHDNPYQALKRVFHEPNRLAIVSALCPAGNGLTFGELKDECDLTDGNLSRHLRMLEESNIIFIRKEFIDSRPRTTVFLSDIGRDRFVDYLVALEEVLKLAGDALELPASESELSLNVMKAARA